MEDKLKEIIHTVKEKGKGSQQAHTKNTITKENRQKMILNSDPLIYVKRTPKETKQKIFQLENERQFSLLKENTNL